MSEVITPIETVYRGFRFRSRLEARWAVFFDAAGIEWEYEPQGYEIHGRRYLPDFWLSRLKIFVETKPDDEAMKQAKPIVELLAKETGHRSLVIAGTPNSFEPPTMLLDGSTAWWEQCPFCHRVSIRNDNYKCAAM
jgi:hypothetical protein